nr:hypothetical transcript [Hymenolepis microstoma]
MGIESVETNLDGAKLLLISLTNPTKVPPIEGGVLTSSVVVQPPSASICADRPNKCPMIHKCHAFKKISPKYVSTSTPSASTSPSTLKSMLESGCRTLEVVPTTSLASVQVIFQSPSNAITFVITVSAPVMFTGLRQDNKTPSAHHQSRITCQVGHRAIVLDVSLNRCSNSTVSPALQ